jgi:HlyD family secretion protein
MKTDESKDESKNKPARPADGRRNQRTGRRKLIVYILPALLIAAAVIGLWPRPTPVDTATVVRAPLTVSVLEEGRTRIRHRYVVSPAVGGYLHRVPHRAGTPIQAGQTVLATIEAEPSQFLDPRTRAVAQARLQSAQAVQEQQRAIVERVQAELGLAQKELERIATLRREDIATQQQLDAADTRVQVLARELNAARSALRAAQFEVQQARANLQQAAAPQADDPGAIRIIAPIDGYILNIFEENARVIPAGTPIMEIGDPRDLEAEIELLSSDAVAVKPGAPVWIDHWGGELPLRGEVHLVEPGAFTKVSALGVEEQRVNVRVNFLETPPPGLELGDRYRVEARIVTWHSDDVLQIPTGALFRRGNAWMAFAVEEGRARLREVQIGQNNGIAAQVRAGLAQDQIVIVYPPDHLADGDRVAPGSGS